MFVHSNTDYCPRKPALALGSASKQYWAKMTRLPSKFLEDWKFILAPSIFASTQRFIDTLFSFYIGIVQKETRRGNKIVVFGHLKLWQLFKMDAICLASLSEPTFEKNKYHEFLFQYLIGYFSYPCILILAFDTRVY